jgi:hypothetical protein
MYSHKIGIQRRQIEDAIVQSFQAVDFHQKHHRYVEQDVFWDYIFGWHNLMRYYELSSDITIGQNMLELYIVTVDLLQLVVQDQRLRERRRDRALNALYQINYYVDQVMLHIERNADSTDNRDGHLN